MFRVQGSGFRVQGLGFEAQGSGFRVQGFAPHEAQGSGFRTPSSDTCLRLDGSGFWVSGFGFLLPVHFGLCLCQQKCGAVPGRARV